MTTQPLPDETLDDLLVNDLHILQKRDAFRFGTDAVALTHFAAPRARDVVLDIGSGTAIIPILAVGQYGARRAIGVEIQPQMVQMSRRSVALNGLDDRIQIIQAPIQQIASHMGAGSVTLVTANPPYFPQGSGQPSPNPSRSLARTEHTLTLAETVAAAAYLLGDGGRFCVIAPIFRLSEVFCTATAHRLEPKRLQLVGRKTFLVECVRGAHIGLRITGAK